MKYLITDDALLGRKILAKKLEDFLKEEDEVIFASNGQEAVNMYKENAPDICFMDLTMPIMDGFEATKQILALNPKAKIFIISADTQHETVRKIIKIGATMFIEKPIDFEKLEKVFEIIEKNEGGNN